MWILFGVYNKLMHMALVRSVRWEAGGNRYLAVTLVCVHAEQLEENQNYLLGEIWALFTQIS